MRLKVILTEKENILIHIKRAHIIEHKRKYPNYIFQFFEKYVTESCLTEEENIIIHI